MKNLIIIIAMAIVANVIGFGPTVCDAQLGGAAPLPEIKKSTGPSLEETKKWITDKLESLPSFMPDPNSQKSNYKYRASFDDCEMTITQEEKSGYYSHSDLQIFYLKLQDMDINSFHVNKYDHTSNMHLKSLGNLENIKVYRINNVNQNSDNPTLISIYDSKSIFDKKITNSSLDEPASRNRDFKHYTINDKQIYLYWYYLNNASISFKDIGVAESMSNALKHAVTLCQKKAAAEKAAQPPKKKDLF